MALLKAALIRRIEKLEQATAAMQVQHLREQGVLPHGVHLVDNDGNSLMGSRTQNPASEVVVHFREGIPRPPEKPVEPSKLATRANALSDADKELLSRCGR